MITVTIVKKKQHKTRSNRIIVPNNKLVESISNNFGVFISNYPMITKPLVLRREVNDSY